MKHLLAAILLTLLAGCSGKGTSSSANTAGASVAGTSTVVGGASGLGSAGTSSAAGVGAVSGAGSAAPGVAGMSGGVAGTAAGPSSAAGASGGGSMAGAGASGTGSDAGSAIPATFETVKLVLGGGGSIMPCFAAPCHGVNGKAPPDNPLELPPTNDQQLYTNLTTYVSKACNNTKLVTPGDPTQSALIKILSGPCGMTPRMPYGCSPDQGDCIPDEHIAAISKWIANGAPRQ